MRIKQTNEASDIMREHDRSVAIAQVALHSRTSTRWMAAAIAVLALFVDQTTKLLALGSLSSGTGVRITSFFDLRLGFNKGVSFGIGQQWFSDHPLALTALTTGIVALLAIWIWRTKSRREATLLAAIAGAALGNIADRLRLGAVVDFLDLHVGSLRWPTFNLADTIIVCAVAGLLFLTRADRA